MALKTLTPFPLVMTFVICSLICFSSLNCKEYGPRSDGPLGAFCNTFDLLEVIIGLENQILVFLRVAVLQVLQGLHRLEKYFNIQICLEKSLKIKFAFKST